MVDLICNIYQDPLISIIIPTYNRGELIEETINSVLAQTYTNWECIIVDDGSTDNTFQIVQKFIDIDKRIQYHERCSLHLPGGNGARNYGLSLSKGEFIQWMDSDDLMHPLKLELQYKALKNYNVDISVCEWDVLNNGEIISTEHFVDKPTVFGGKDYLNNIGITKVFFITDVFLVSKKILKKHSLWNESLRTNQDGEFFSRIISHDIRIIALDRTLCYYRRDSSNRVSTAGINEEKLKEKIRSIQLINANIQVTYKDDIPTHYLQYNSDELFRFILHRNYIGLIKKNIELFNLQIKRYGKLKFFLKNLLIHINIIKSPIS